MSRLLSCLLLTISVCPLRLHVQQVVVVMLLGMLFVNKRAKKDGLRGSMYLAEGLVGAEMSQNQQRVAA